MLSLNSATWAGEGHIPLMCPREWTEADVGAHRLAAGTGDSGAIVPPGATTTPTTAERDIVSERDKLW
jgi:hypothetical protein